MRYILQRVILQAVKIENQGSRLLPMTVPISLESYVTASELVEGEIEAKCTEWHNQIIAFKVFNDEEEFFIQTTTNASKTN